MAEATLESQLEELLDQETFSPSSEFASHAVISDPEIHEKANSDPEGFWAEQAETLDWAQKWDQVLDWSNPPFAKWFVGGKLNVAYNCVDRHVEAGRGDRVAFHWRGEEGEERDVTYADLHRDVQRCANALKERGIGPGDVVGIFLPMIPEVAVAMLACARIGAPHNVVFGGFSVESVKERMEFSEAKALITVDGARRKGKTAPIKQQVDEVMGGLDQLETIIVVKHTGAECSMQESRDFWWHTVLEAAGEECPAEPFDAEHPLYILYTSGSTAKPKGILHTTGGYLTQVAWTHRNVFDLKPDEDVYWCSADVGWVTGHSYIVYGPLANGCTSVMYEGAPDYPDKDIWWELVARYKVTLFYTAPTAIRACIKWGAEYPGRHDLSTLRLLGTVGEPINPKAWLWYHKVIGSDRCPIVDTWWQTETGAIMITTLPGIQDTKPGSAGKPLPGIEAAVLDREGEDAGTEQGFLVAAQAVAVDAADALQGGGPLRRHLLVQVRQGRLLRGRRGAARRGRLLLDHRARRRRHQRVRPPALDRRGGVGDRLARARGRGGGDRPAGRGHRPGDHGVRDALGDRRRRRRRAGGRHPRARRQADRQAGAAEAHHLGRRPAEDALRQDHAPAAARHRRGPRAGRRDHAPRPRRDVAARGEDQGAAGRRGVRLHWEETGDGPPVLLIMGLGMNATGWWRTIPALEGFRVIAFDNRGVGRSERVPGPYTAAEMADDAVSVLDEAGVDAAHVYGISLGGMIAQEVALRHPDRVRALVLGATTAGGANLVPAEEAVNAFVRLRAQMTAEHAVWASVPINYARRTRLEGGARIAEDIAQRLRFPVERGVLLGAARRRAGP